MYLHSAAVAASPRCNTVRPKLVQLNPSYPITTTSSSISETPSPTTSPSPSVSACVPVPDGQEFRISIVDSRDYLTGSDGGNLPVSSDGSTLTTTPDYSHAIPFRAASGKNGQITLLNADGTTLYSDQDLTGSGDEPIYFDTLQTSEDSNMYPVQFCLQPDNTFVVQNLGTQDPNDDASIVQICPGDGAVYLHTASAAAIRGCTTVRLQIVNARPAVPTSTSSTSSTAPTATVYKEGRFRVRMAAPWTEGYMTNFDSGVGKAIPENSEANFAPISDESLAVIFETVSGQNGLVVLYNVNNEALYLNRDRNPGGPVYANTQASITDNEYIPISSFVRQDDTIVVQNLGQDAADSADDSSTFLLCPNSRGPTYQMFAANNPAIPSDCVAQTLIAEFVVPAVSSTSTSTLVSSPTPPPYVPPVGCLKAVFRYQLANCSASNLHYTPTGGSLAKRKAPPQTSSMHGFSQQRLARLVKFPRSRLAMARRMTVTSSPSFQMTTAIRSSIRTQIFRLKAGRRFNSVYNLTTHSKFTLLVETDQGLTM